MRTVTVGLDPSEMIQSLDSPQKLTILHVQTKALSVERFAAYLCGVKHAAEVQPFPRIPGIVSPLQNGVIHSSAP